MRGRLTPKNRQRMHVDVSRQLRAVLRLSRRQQRTAWLKRRRPLPEWVFPSVTGTGLDESNVRKAFNRILDAVGLHRITGRPFTISEVENKILEMVD